MPMYKKVQKQVDGVLKSTRENLLGIRVIRAFNRQRSEEENIRSQSGQLYNKQIHVGKISALLNPLTYMIINLGIIAILWSGGKQVDLGYLTQGQIIALINYMSQILVELVKLANLLIILSRAFASLDRVDQIFALEPSMKETGKTDIEEKKQEIEQILSRRSQDATIVVTGNIGRDVLPMLLLKEKLSRYDYVGHFHTKKSKEADFWAGESWRKELIDMLVKPADQILANMEANPKVGITIGEIPTYFRNNRIVVAWNEALISPEMNKLWQRMGATKKIDFKNLNTFVMSYGTFVWFK